MSECGSNAMRVSWCLRIKEVRGPLRPMAPVVRGLEERFQVAETPSVAL